MHRLNLSFIAPLLLVFALLSCSTEALPDPDITYDLKIVNARIVDGTGSPSYTGSVLVLGNEIVFVGRNRLKHIGASQEIDAAGRVVTPGFIDAHAHGNAELNPEFRNFWSMGVTTILLGMDGSSPGIENLPNWIENVNHARPGVNIAHLVGHGTARHASGIGFKTDPPHEEIENLKAIIREQLVAGSFGVSTGTEYVPGMYAGREELAEVARAVSEFDGIIMSHIRNEDDDAVANSVRELIQMGSDGEARVHVSHIKIVYGNNPVQAERVLAVMDSARAAGVAITADVYPYIASYTGIGILYPDWALPPNDFQEVVQNRREELAEYLRNRVNRRNGPEATLLGTEPWTGKTLAEIASEMNKPFEDVLIDHIPPGSASGAYFVMNMDVMARFLSDPHVMVSSDGSPTMLHPRGYGAFARIIRQFVVETEMLSLEQAVHKMSGQTASVLRLDENRASSAEAGVSGSDAALMPRGLLKKGFAADILIFDPVRVRDTATFEKPHQYAQGMDFVIINGVVVQSEGIPTGERPGQVLLSR